MIKNPERLFRVVTFQERRAHLGPHIRPHPASPALSRPRSVES